MILLAIFYAFFSLMAAIATVIVSVAARSLGSALKSRQRWLASPAAVLVGSLVGPGVLLIGGFRLGAPWPWHRAEAMRDGFPPGPLMVISSVISLPICLLLSYAIIRRRHVPGELPRPSADLPHVR